MNLKRPALLLLDLLFPPRCVFCGAVVAPGTKVCRPCSRSIVPLNTVRRMNLSDVGKNIPCAVLYPYSGEVRQSILRFKFGGEKQNADFYAERMAVTRIFSGERFDAVTSVPISKEREKTRGYNQSELIARQVARKIDVPFEECLMKIKDNPEQHRLKKKDRRSNVKNAYRAAESNLLGKRILLVDDIVTTGATLSECAKVLYGAGVSEVACAAVAESSLESVEMERVP
jgi:competence protein ComFC